MDPDMRKELRDYAWKYFDRHAEQRLKAFNFYIVLYGAVLTGVFAAARDGGNPRFAFGLAIVLTWISFVFYKLDKRTRDLTKHSEEALKHLEQQMDLPDEAAGVPHRCKLFRREEYEFSKLKREMPQNYSYSTCFRLIFYPFGFAGIGLAIYFWQQL